MKEIDATYDPSASGGTGSRVPIEPGSYPAHVCGYSTREVNTKAGPATVVNLQYVVADEAKHQVQKMWDMEGWTYKTDVNGDRIPLKNGSGEQLTTGCSHMVDKRFYGNGVFLFQGGGSSSKNRFYFEFLKALGIATEEVEVDGKKVQKLMLVEEDDVVGLPCYVRIKREEWVDKKTNEKRGAWKANRVFPWIEGSRLSPEEVDPNADVPF